MRYQDAINILALTEPTLESLKSAYRAAALRYHPDRFGGDLDMMKLVNAAYELLKNTFPQWKVYCGSGRKAEPIGKARLDELILEMYAKIKDLPGLEVELCGCWLWVSGSIKTHADDLKKAGYQYSTGKNKYYWGAVPPKGGRPFSMSKIRSTFGSETLNKENVAREEKRPTALL
jgi:hypothetical protein